MLATKLFMKLEINTETMNYVKACPASQINLITKAYSAINTKNNHYVTSGMNHDEQSSGFFLQISFDS